VNRHVAKPLRLIGAYRRLLINVPGFPVPLGNLLDRAEVQEPNEKK
jgi:hypothetical protein